MYVRHTRRRLTRLTQGTALLVVALGVGCGGSVYYANSGVGGVGGKGGSDGAGSAGNGGDCNGCDAVGESDGAGGAGDGTGTGGSAVGTGGSIGGTDGGVAGTGGSVGGAGGSTSAGGGGQAGQVTLQPWPTGDAVVTVDSVNQFPKNLSDLVYEPPSGGGSDVLWAIQNDPSTLYRLTWNGTTWSGVATDGWTAGKLIHYPDGSGAPDSEGLTRAEWSSPTIYVSTERDNNNGNVSRMSVLLYDTSAAGAELTAMREWNLTPDLPVSGANLGLEAIAWVPDTYLVANGFFDELAKAAYDPARYPNHGTGLFFVGLESNGMIYGYALDHSAGTFQRVATIASGHPSIMSLDFDRDVGNLWAYCDNTCVNQAAVLRISGGRFVVESLYDHPSTLPNSNMEGITIAPESECAQGKKSFFWSDDADYGGHALYRGTIPCGLLP